MLAELTIGALENERGKELIMNLDSLEISKNEKYRQDIFSRLKRSKSLRKQKMLDFFLEKRILDRLHEKQIELYTDRL